MEKFLQNPAHFMQDMVCSLDGFVV